MKCEICGEDKKPQGMPSHMKAHRAKNETKKTDEPTVITKEYLTELLVEADRLEERAKELRAFVLQLEQYPYDKLDGYVVMIAKKA